MVFYQIDIQFNISSLIHFKVLKDKLTRIYAYLYTYRKRIADVDLSTVKPSVRYYFS